MKRTAGLLAALGLAIVVGDCDGREPRFTIDPEVPTITPVNRPYAVQLTLRGSGTFSACEPNRGYTVTPSGALRWTPTITGAQVLCVNATSSDGQRTTQLAWLVTVQSPREELQAWVDRWRATLASIAPAGSCARALIGEPLVVLDAHDLTGEPLGTWPLARWRPSGLLVAATTPPEHVARLVGARHALVVTAAEVQAPRLLAPDRFEPGRFRGTLQLVDLTTRASLCGTELAFESSHTLVARDFARGEPADVLERDFLRAGSRALVAAAVRVAPGIGVAMPVVHPGANDATRAEARVSAALENSARLAAW